MVPSPLLEFFKRGEAARDVRLLAAQGGLGVRAHDQLAILIQLLDDADPEIRTTADATLNRIPSDVLSRFLGRSDIPIGIREFFADRGIFPEGDAAPDSEQPLVEAEHDDAFAADENEDKETVSQKIAAMSMPEKLKAATKGTKEMRAILVRDPNKMIAAAVMSSPKLTENEIEAISRMANVSEDVLRMIATNRAWTRNYSVVVGLTKNPKTPVALSMNLMQRLSDKHVTQLSVDRNVPEALRAAARKRVVSNTSKH